MNKPIIRAKKDCAKCDGRCYATSFIGGFPVLCDCIEDQIDLRSHEGLRPRFEKSDDKKTVNLFFDKVSDE